MLNSNDGVVFGDNDGGVTPAVKVDTVAAFCLNNRTLTQEISLRAVSGVILLAVRQDKLYGVASQPSLLAAHDSVRGEAKDVSGVQGDHLRAPFVTFVLNAKDVPLDAHTGVPANDLRRDGQRVRRPPSAAADERQRPRLRRLRAA